MWEVLKIASKVKMKTFYTEQDIADLQTTGVCEIKVNDDVVLTDLAREKALALGIQLTSGEPSVGQAETIMPAGAGPSSPLKPVPQLTDVELAAAVKARVIARLGTAEYNEVLDQIIPLVVARLTDNPQASPTQPSGSMADSY